MLYSFLEENNLLDLPSETAALYARSVTQKNIETADVRTYFREQLMWYRTDAITMAGSIQDAKASLPADLQLALGELWSSLFGGSATTLLTNSNIGIATRIKAGISALEEAGVVTETQSEGFFLLGDGLIFPDANSDAIAAAKQSHAAQEAAAAAEEARIEAEMELRNEWDVAMGTAGAEEAFYNGDQTALIEALNAAVVKMSTSRRG